MDGRCFAARPFASFQLERIEGLTRSTHSCAGEEDDFSELGLPVEQSVGTFPMLMTEKPETFKVCFCRTDSLSLSLYLYWIE